jgi:hypothetical protein
MDFSIRFLAIIAHNGYGQSKPVFPTTCKSSMPLSHEKKHFDNLRFGAGGVPIVVVQGNSASKTSLARIE